MITGTRTGQTKTKTILSLYHLLTRCGLDKNCAASLMVELCITPQIRAFRKMPRKKRSYHGFKIIV